MFTYSPPVKQTTGKSLVFFLRSMSGSYDRRFVSNCVVNSRNGEIHITADRYYSLVIVEIQERKNYNGYALSYSVGSLATEAAACGGYLSIKGPQQKVTTITFSFPDNQAA